MLHPESLSKFNPNNPFYNENSFVSDHRKIAYYHLVEKIRVTEASHPENTPARYNTLSNHHPRISRHHHNNNVATIVLNSGTDDLTGNPIYSGRANFIGCNELAPQLASKKLAYLSNVYVVEEQRGQNGAQAMISAYQQAHQNTTLFGITSNPSMVHIVEKLSGFVLLNTRKVFTHNTSSNANLFERSSRHIFCGPRYSKHLRKYLAEKYQIENSQKRAHDTFSIPVSSGFDPISGTKFTIYREWMYNNLSFTKDQGQTVVLLDHHFPQDPSAAKRLAKDIAQFIGPTKFINMLTIPQEIETQNISSNCLEKHGMPKLNLDRARAKWQKSDQVFFVIPALSTR